MENRDQDAFNLRYEWLSSADLHYVSELDRSEQIRLNYEAGDGMLKEIEVTMGVPRWYTVLHIPHLCVDLVAIRELNLLKLTRRDDRL